MADKKGSDKAFVMLETAHPIIVDTLTELFATERVFRRGAPLPGLTRRSAKREPVDVKLADFDGVEYQILVTPEAKDAVLFSMKMRCASQVMPMGAKLVLDATFGQNLAHAAQTGYDVSVKYDLTKLSDADKPKAIKSCSELRYIVMGAPLERCLEALSKDGSGSLKPMIVNYRPKEAMYVNPMADRILIFFTVDFFDDTDRAIATIFLNEFGEAQRRLQNAPAVAFSKEPPGQLKAVPGFKESPNCVGYVMFTVFKLHVDKPEKIRNATQLFLTFRSYLHYHIKAAKTQLQTRMRARVETMLKILNRANPETLEAEKSAGRRNTTTNTMRTFRRF